MTTLFINLGCVVELSRKDAEKLLGEKRVEDLVEVLTKSKCIMSTRQAYISAGEVEDFNYEFDTKFPEERVRFGDEHKWLDVKFINA